MQDLQTNLGLRVAQLRKSAHLTQTQLAERADTTLDTVSRLERGVSTPSLGKINDLARALKVPLWQLLYHDGDDQEAYAAEVAAMVKSCDKATAVLVRDVVARIVADRAPG